MKKILVIIYILLLLLLLKLVASFTINELFIAKYEDEIYEEEDTRKLFFLNTFEPYTAYYNHGNVLYYNRNFDGAISEYEKALELSPPEDKERDVERNLELAKRMKEQTESNTEEEKDNEEDDEEDEEEEKDDKKTDEIEKELKEMQKESRSTRAEELETVKRLDEDYEYYSGKTW